VEGKLEQTHSDLVEIAKRNGDFRKNYGILIGAFLYLRSVSATRGRPLYWTGLIMALLSAALSWVGELGSWWF
jgi:hypothetical protein